MIRKPTQDRPITIVNGNCFDYLDSLDYVTAVVTDPPYGIAVRSNDSTGKFRRKWEPVAGDKSSSSGDWVINWATRTGKALIVFASPWKPWSGTWRNLIAWNKGESVGGSGDTKTCLKRTWELIQVNNNGPINGPRKGSVWTHIDSPTHKGINGPCSKPVELMVELIETFTQPGDVVLDTFMGTGSTMIPCLQTGRYGIGIEINSKAFFRARERLIVAGCPLPG